MSRGHGRIQLQVLDFLLRYDESARARGDDNSFVSIAEIAGVAASRSRTESVRRAVKSLADEGLILLRVDTPHRSTGSRSSLSRVHPDRGLTARLANAEDGQQGRQHAS
jgi:hypothetical protein